MAITNALQAIASESAQVAVDNFLETLPSELLDQLSQDFIDNIDDDLQADIQVCIHSRLQWSLQAAQTEIDEQQRLQQLHQHQAQHQMNFLPPEPIQKLPERKLENYQKSSRYVIQKSVDSDTQIRVKEAGTTDSYLNESQPYLTLNKSPNRHRRRRRRSAEAEHQEFLLNST